jgi:MFS transporter, DHA1 family, multidrug resistance protein
MGSDPEVQDNQPVENSIHPNVVDWDGPDDPKNPRNWSVWRRGMIVGIVTCIVFST